MKYFLLCRIRPRKGQYLIFDKAAKGVISSSILPVPTEKTKGVIVFNSGMSRCVVCHKILQQ